MTEQGDLIRHQPHLKERASNEFKRFLVIFLYLWAVFGFLSIHKSFILSQHHLDYREHAFAFINAFVFAKVLLFAEDFNLGTRFRDKPLIYPVLHKCFLFTLVVVGFHITEVALVGLWHGG
jgi:membrane associated rhomboid family serine protease